MFSDIIVLYSDRFSSIKTKRFWRGKFSSLTFSHAFCCAQRYGQLLKISLTERTGIRGAQSTKNFLRKLEKRSLR